MLLDLGVVIILFGFELFDLFGLLDLDDILFVDLAVEVIHLIFCETKLSKLIIDCVQFILGDLAIIV